MTALGRYYVMRDQALEAGDDAGVLAADLGLEMVHRPPEEWELSRVTVWWNAFSWWPPPREGKTWVIESATWDPDIWTGRAAGDKRRTREFQQAMEKRLRRR